MEKYRNCYTFGLSKFFSQVGVLPFLNFLGFLAFFFHFAQNNKLLSLSITQTQSSCSSQLQMMIYSLWLLLLGIFWQVCGFLICGSHLTSWAFTSSSTRACFFKRFCTDARSRPMSSEANVFSILERERELERIDDNILSILSIRHHYSQKQGTLLTEKNNILKPKNSFQYQQLCWQIKLWLL